MINILEHLLDQKKSCLPSEHDFIAFLFSSGQNRSASTKSPKSRFLRFSWKIAFSQFFFEVVYMIAGGPKWGPDMFKTCFTPFFDILSYFWAFCETLKKIDFEGEKSQKSILVASDLPFWVQKITKNHQNSSAYPSAISKIKT